MTVQELIDQLSRCPEANRGKQVVAWLPGSRIELAGVMPFSFDKAEVLVEGNVREGSVLHDIVMRD